MNRKQAAADREEQKIAEKLAAIEKSLEGVPNFKRDKILKEEKIKLGLLPSPTPSAPSSPGRPLPSRTVSASAAIDIETLRQASREQIMQNEAEPTDEAGKIRLARRTSMHAARELLEQRVQSEQNSASSSPSRSTPSSPTSPRRLAGGPAKRLSMTGRSPPRAASATKPHRASWSPGKHITTPDSSPVKEISQPIFEVRPKVAGDSPESVRGSESPQSSPSRTMVEPVLQARTHFAANVQPDLKSPHTPDTASEESPGKKKLSPAKELWNLGADKAISEAHAKNPQPHSGDRLADIAVAVWEREKQRIRDESKRRECDIYRKELVQWFADLFSVYIDDEDDAFYHAIDDGVMLCRLAAEANRADEEFLGKHAAMVGGNSALIKAIEKAGNRKSIKDPTYRETRGLDAFARDNIQGFIKWSRAFGIQEAVIFEANSIKKRDRTVLLCLMEVARESHLEIVPQLVSTERMIDNDDGVDEAEEARRREEELARLEAEIRAAEAAEAARLERERLAAEAAEAKRIEEERKRLAELKRIEEARRAQRLEEERLQAEILAMQEQEMQAKLMQEAADRRAQLMAEEFKRQQEAAEREAALRAERERARLAEIAQQREEEERRIAERREAEARAKREAELQREREEEERKAERERIRLAEIERQRQAAEAAEQARLLKIARQQEADAKAAAEALRRLQEMAAAAERKREEEAERLRIQEEQQRKDAAEAAARLERRRRLLANQAVAQDHVNVLRHQLEVMQAAHAEQRSSLEAGVAELVQRREELQAQIDADESEAGKAQLDQLHRRIAEQEHMQKVLAEQQAETDKLHEELEAELEAHSERIRVQNQEKAAREHEIAIARSKYELARQAKLQAHDVNIGGADALDTEVQKMLKETGNTVQLIRLREGTYLIQGTTKRIFIRILHTNIMVRVGGGWETLRHWLKSHKSNINPGNVSARSRIGSFKDQTIMVGKEVYKKSAKGSIVKADPNDPTPEPEPEPATTPEPVRKKRANAKKTLEKAKDAEKDAQRELAALEARYEDLGKEEVDVEQEREAIEANYEAKMAEIENRQTQAIEELHTHAEKSTELAEREQRVLSDRIHASQKTCVELTQSITSSKSDYSEIVKAFQTEEASLKSLLKEALAERNKLDSEVNSASPLLSRRTYVVSKTDPVDPLQTARARAVAAKQNIEAAKNAVSQQPSNTENNELESQGTAPEEVEEVEIISIAGLQTHADSLDSKCEFEPDVEPVDKSEYESNATPEPQSELDPEPKSEPEPEPKPESEPKAEPEPKSEPKPEPKAEPELEAEPVSELEPQSYSGLEIETDREPELSLKESNINHLHAQSRVDENAFLQSVDNSHANEAMLASMHHLQAAKTDISDPLPELPSGPTNDDTADVPALDAGTHDEVPPTVNATVNVDLFAFLDSLGLIEKAMELLAENDVTDLETLQELTKEDLVSIGLKIGPAAKIYNAAQRTTNTPVMPVATPLPPAATPDIDLSVIQSPLSRPSSVQPPILPSPAPADTHLGLSIGTRVSSKLGKGTVRWIGTAKLSKKMEPWCGVEMDQFQEKGGNGTIGGTVYFVTDPGHGLFLKPRKLTALDSSSV